VDRVVPAFVRAALAGEPLRVDGRDHTFDFTHVDDVTRGLIAVTRALDRGEELPVLHLLTGRATTLGQLADAVVALVSRDRTAPRLDAPPRTFDVARFVGDPARAAAVLGWTARVGLGDGLARLVDDLRPAVATGRRAPPPAVDGGP